MSPIKSLQNDHISIKEILIFYLVLWVVLKGILEFLVDERLWFAKGENKSTLLFIIEIVIIFFTYLYVVFRIKVDAHTYLALAKPKITYLFYSLILSLIMFGLYYILLYDYQSANFRELTLDQSIIKIQEIPYYSIMLKVLILPVSEGIIFRGALLSSVMQKYGFVIAALFSSILWSVLHIGNTSFVGLALIIFLIFNVILGFLLCYLRYRAKSIWPAIVSHVCINILMLWVLVISRYTFVN